MKDFHRFRSILTQSYHVAQSCSLNCIERERSGCSAGLTRHDLHLTNWKEPKFSGGFQPRPVGLRHLLFFQYKINSSNVYLIPLCDMADNFTSGRIDGRKGFLAFCVVPLIVNENLQRKKEAHWHTPVFKNVKVNFYWYYGHIANQWIKT